MEEITSMKLKSITLIICFFPLLLLGQKIEKDSISKYLPKGFNGQVAIKQTDGFLFKGNYGPRSLNAPQILINDSTLFNTGEIAHTLIHYFVQHLAGLNQIKVTDPVKKYIQNFPYPNITIQHLVNHQSGLPTNYVKVYHRGIYNDINIKLHDKSIRFDNEDILNALYKLQPPLTFTPGDSIRASNLDYLVLASLIEVITFTPFEDFVTRLFKHHNFVFSPVVAHHSDTLINKAYGYKVDLNRVPVIFENLRSIGFDYDDGTAGNQHIYLNAGQLALWGQFLFSSIDTEYLMSNPTKEVMGGIRYNTQKGIIEKEGRFGGITSHLILIPGNDLIVTINSNLALPNNDFSALISYIKKL